jgi:hypothetical protein
MKPTSDDAARLSGACVHTLTDAKGWPLQVTSDQLIDFIVDALGSRIIERLKVRHFFLDLPQNAPAAEETESAEARQRDLARLTLPADRFTVVKQ